MISTSFVRNDMILEDTRSCIRDGRTSVILTRYKEHAKHLYEHLQENVDYVFLLYGDNSDKENSDVRRRLKGVPKGQGLVLVATRQKMGKGIVVSSPELTQDKVERFIYLIKLRQEAGVEVTVITAEPQNKAYGSSEFAQRMIQEMQENGIYVIVKDEVAEHFAVIDDELVWHGGMNLLGREDARDNLMRIKSDQVASGLLIYRVFPRNIP